MSNNILNFPLQETCNEHNSVNPAPTILTHSFNCGRASARKVNHPPYQVAEVNSKERKPNLKETVE